MFFRLSRPHFCIYPGFSISFSVTFAHAGSSQLSKEIGHCKYKYMAYIFQIFYQKSSKYFLSSPEKRKFEGFLRLQKRKQKPLLRPLYSPLKHPFCSVCATSRLRADKRISRKAPCSSVASIIRTFEGEKMQHDGGRRASLFRYRKQPW